MKVAATVLAIHAIWIAVYIVAGHEPRDFIKLGPDFVRQSSASDVIRYDPAYAYPRNHEGGRRLGFDGQFSYYMAVDFPNARYYMDDAAYRYTRLLYPAIASAFALGQADAVPYTMLLLNWLAVGAGTLALAAWLRRKSVSPWFALVYGLFPGLTIGLQRDLTEPLAYGLVAVGVYLFDFAGRRRVLWAGAAFGLAALARQTTLVFPACYALALALGPPGSRSDGESGAKWGDAALLAALAFLPIAAYTGYLYAWLGRLGSGAFLEPIPFLGLVTSEPWELVRQPPEIVTLVVPGLICAGLALAALRRGPPRVELACLLANVLLFTVFLGEDVYSSGYPSPARASVAIVLAAVLCIPYLAPLTRRARVLMGATALLWLAMLPVVLVYELSEFQV